MGDPREPLSRGGIVEATRRVLVGEGFDAVSLRRIARELGVTAPALYAHIENKRDLMAAIAEQEFVGMITAFKELDDGNAIETLRRRIKYYIDWARKNPALYQVVYRFRPTQDVGESVAGLAAYQELVKLSRIPITRAIEEGHFRPLPEDVIYLTLWAVVDGLIAVSIEVPEEAVGPGGKGIADSVVETGIDMAIRGLAAAR